jgi:Tfp pilus assembly protein PilV
MIATGIMVTALLAVAAMFAYSIRTTLYSQQLSTGTVVSNLVVENIMASGFTALSNGGGINPASPQAGYFNYVDLSGAGAVTFSTVNTSMPFLAMWQIDGTNPKRITVSVHAQRNGVSGQNTELIRTTTQMASGR